MTRASAVLLVALAGLAACTPDRGPRITTGSKKFTESVILGEMIARLAGAAGGDARHRAELGGTRVLWNALLAGDIDAYPEYTGTIAREILAGGGGAIDPAAIEPSMAEHGIGMSAPLGFDNTYALGMLSEKARERGIETISDLKKHPDLSLGFTNEFMDRRDGWPALRETYDLPQTDVAGLDHDLAYRGLAAGAIDVIDLYSTDAEIAEYGLAVLEDDRGCFAEYRAVILYRRDLEERAPGALAAILRLQGLISEADMIEMNSRVKIEGRREGGVAAAFLQRALGVAGGKQERSAAARLAARTAEHLMLVGISLGAAILAAVPLGILAARRERIGRFVLGAAGVIQTIPSLALLVFMIPLLGIGAKPAIAALFLYSLLPVVRNTHAGIKGIPLDLKESAEALGLTPAARLRLVELPLAAPQILAGIKTSAVINVGTATLGALIGAGGYGQPILTGIRLDDSGLILQGAVPAALLALFVQGAFDLLERVVVSSGLRLAPDAAKL